MDRLSFLRRSAAAGLALAGVKLGASAIAEAAPAPSPAEFVIRNGDTLVINETWTWDGDAWYRPNFLVVPPWADDMLRSMIGPSPLRVRAKVL